MDRRVERGELALSALLRTGVVLSVAVTALGLVLLFATGGQTHLMDGGTSRLIAYPPTASALHVESTLRDVAQGLAAGDPAALIALGLLMLIATPIMRVAASVVLYALEGDYRYVAITLFVLGVLVLGMWLGKAE